MKNKNRITRKVVVDPDTGCWNWKASLNSSGYGQLTENRVYWLSHRYAYEVYIGKIPDGLIVRHICHNTKCSNPDHLLVGTHLDNYNDSREKHNEARLMTRGEWDINGVKYGTIREARLHTGISMGSLNKYTDNGVFDVAAYREGCLVAGWDSKI